MNKKNSLRVLSVILTVIMIFTMIPVTVFAADGNCTHPSITEDNKCTECNADIVAKIVEYNQTEATYFSDFDEALALASTEDYQVCTLSLLTDWHEPIELTQGNFYFDANSHTVYGTITLRKNAILRITDGKGTFRGTIYGYDYSYCYVSGGIYGDVTRDDEYLMVEMNGHAQFVAESTIVCLGTIQANESSVVDLKYGRYTGKLISNTGYYGFLLRDVNIYSEMIANGVDMYGDPCGFRLLGGTYYDGCTMTISDGGRIEASGYIEIKEPVKINVYDNNNSGSTLYVTVATVNCPVNVYGGTLEADYRAAKFTNTVTIADGASAELTGGSFAKLTFEGDKTCADALVKRYVYRNSSDKSLVENANVKTLENVYVEECSEHTFDDDHICTICGAIADALVIDADGNATAFDTFGEAMENAQTLTGIVTVKLLDNFVIDSSTSIMAGDGIILDMNGKRIGRNLEDTSGNMPGVITAKKLTVTGNGSSSIFFGVMAYGDNVGELIIENGTYDSFIAAMGPAKLTINDATVNGHVALDDYNGFPIVELNGGSYKKLAAAVSADGSFDWYSALGEGKGYYSTAGVKFGDIKLNDVNAYGFDGTESGSMITVVDHHEHSAITGAEDHRCRECGANIVASAMQTNGGRPYFYETFEEAVESAKAISGESMIYLFDDVSLTSEVDFSAADADITLNLNGHTINDATEDGSAMIKYDKGALTIKGDGIINVSIDAMNYADKTVGKLVIENGTFNKSIRTVFSTEINGGTFNDELLIMYADMSDSRTIVINDGYFKDVASDCAVLDINGGTFEKLYTFSFNDIFMFLGEGKGYYADVEGNMFARFTYDKSQYLNSVYGYNGTADKPLKVLDHKEHNKDENGKCYNCGAQGVASVTSKDVLTKYYDTLEDAVKAAKEQKGACKIKLYENTTIYYEVDFSTSGSSITLDLNGYTIDTVDFDGIYLLHQSGTLTITGNGTINAMVLSYSEDTTATAAPGKLVIENGNFKFVEIAGIDSEIYGGTFTEAVIDYMNDDTDNYIYDGYFKFLAVETPKAVISGGTMEIFGTTQLRKNDFFDVLGSGKGYYADVEGQIFGNVFEIDGYSYDGYNGTADKPLKVLNHPSHNQDESGICINCGAKVSFSLTVSGGTLVSKEIRKDLNSEYYLATITAPVQKPGTNLYFVYWKDADTGETVSTYTTYKFFLVRNINLEAVYETPENYYDVRNERVATSRIAGSKWIPTNSTISDYSTFKLYIEHSVSKANGSIKGHGVLYTTDENSIDSLVRGTDNEHVSDKVAVSSSNALTGMLEITLSVNTANGPAKVWARPYIIDKNNNVIYGTPTLVDGTTTYGEPTVVILKTPDRIEGQSSDGELITLGSQSYDLTELNSDGEAPVEFNEPTEKSLFDRIADLFAKLVSIIKTFIAYIMNTGAKK